MAKLTEEQKRQRARTRARNEALRAEEQDREDVERREMWKREGVYLSWEEYKAGESCRGCGRPMNDGLGDWPALMYLAEDEKREYDAAEELFRERHPNCKQGRWTISGSRTAHCMRCCPPPPMGPKQAKELGKLLGPLLFQKEERKKDLDAWELTLTCDHTVRHLQHRDHSYVSARVVKCPECEARRGVVHSDHVGPACTDEQSERNRREAGNLRLTEELAAAKAKLERQQKNATATQRRIAEIEEQMQEPPG